MTKHTDKVFIVDPLTEVATPGYYAIKKGRNHLDRGFALLIDKVDGLTWWSCWYDGKLVGKSIQFRSALGEFSQHTYLIGRPLNSREYLDLLKLRRNDAESGLDIDAPIDFNNVRLRS